MNEDIEKILNQLENSIKEPVFLGEDYYTGEGWEEPNFFCLDPTTNDCKTLFNYIEQLQNNWNELKKMIEERIKELNPKGLEIGQFNIQNDDYTMGQYGVYRDILVKIKEIEEGNNA